MEGYPRKSTRELVLDLNTSHFTICFHLKKIRKVSMEIFNRKRSVILLFDNTRPESARITLKKILILGWYLLLHTSYLIDFILSDFCLYCSIQNSHKKIRWNCLQKFFEFETSWILLEKNQQGINLTYGTRWFKIIVWK